MLKRPYKYFYKRDSNRYYLLNVVGVYYLAIETILPYGKRMNKEFTQALKLLPIYAPIQLLLLNFANVKERGVKELEGVGEEKLYEQVSVPTVRMKIAELTKTITAESRFDYDSYVKSETARRYIKDGGYQVLTIENYDSFTKSFWVAKSDKYGKLTIQEILAAGRDQIKMMAINSFVLDKELVEALLVALYRDAKRNEKESVKKIEKDIEREENL